MGYSKLLLFGAAEGAGERTSVGAYVVVFVCSVSQKVSKAALWQKKLHLEETALKQGLAGCTVFA